MYVICSCVNSCCIYPACLSPAFNGRSDILCINQICNGIILNVRFLLGMATHIFIRTHLANVKL